MHFRERVDISEEVNVRSHMGARFAEEVKLGRAKGIITHRRPTRFIRDPKTGLSIPDPESYEILSREEVFNLITNAGRDFYHAQCWGTAGVANGLNYIALSDDTVTEGPTSTVLSNEITTNGLARAQGTVAHVAATNLTTIDHSFTCTLNSGSMKCQKAALFSAASGGTMNHVLGFTERTLFLNDIIDTTFQLTLG